MARGGRSGDSYNEDFDSVDVKGFSPGDAVGNAYAQATQLLNSGDKATFDRTVAAIKMAKDNPAAAGPTNVLLSQVNPDVRKRLLEASGMGEAIAAAEAETEAAMAQDTGPAKGERYKGNPRFSLSTYGGSDFADRVRSYGTARSDRNQVDSVAGKELNFIRNWQRSQLASTGMAAEDVAEMSDADLAKQVGFPSLEEIGRVSEGRRVFARASPVSEEGDMESQSRSLGTGMRIEGAQSTQEARTRLLQSLLEKGELIDIPRTFPWWKAQFPKMQYTDSGIYSPQVKGAEIVYPKTQMDPKYYTGFFLDSLGIEPNQAEIDKYSQLVGRSVDHYAGLPPTTAKFGKTPAESSYAQEYLVPEAKNGLPVLYRMLELEGGHRAPARRIQSSQKGMLSLRPDVPMFTDKPLNRGDSQPFELRDVLIDKPEAAVEAEQPPVTPPENDFGANSRPDYRSMSPQLLRALLA